MMNLSLNELKLIARSRRIKGYKRMSKKRLLSALNELESVESEKNFDDARIKRTKIDSKKSREIFKTKTKRDQNKSL